MKKIIYQLLFMGLFVFSLPGQATTFADLGTIADTGATLSSGNIANGSFTHDWAFEVSAASGFVATVNSLQFLGSGLSFASLSLLDGSFNSVANGMIMSLPLGNGFEGNFGAIGHQTLSSDTPYFLRISGDVVGAGNYTGSISVSPVPETEEWIMLLIGLGLVLFQVMRGAHRSEQVNGIGFSRLHLQ